MLIRYHTYQLDLIQNLKNGILINQNKMLVKLLLFQYHQITIELIHLVRYNDKGRKAF